MAWLEYIIKRLYYRLVSALEARVLHHKIRR
jgi:hypothetical protein